MGAAAPASANSASYVGVAPASMQELTTGSPVLGIGHGRRARVEAKLREPLPVVVVVPEEVLEARVEERRAIHVAVTVEVGVDVEQLLRGVHELRGLALGVCDGEHRQ